MTWWCELWEIRWPEAIPQMAEGKAAHLARIETQLGVDELSRRMTRYLADEDPWLLKHKHPVGGFLGSATAPSATQTSGGTTMPATTATGRGRRGKPGGVGTNTPARRRSGSDDGLRQRRRQIL